MSIVTLEEAGAHLRLDEDDDEISLIPGWIGVAILGGIGGGKNTLPKANDGTGTVLGDPTAQSASIKNALDALKDIDDVTLTVSRDMLSSLWAAHTSVTLYSRALAATGHPFTSE